MRDNMQNSPLQERFADIFAHLRGQDVEQFYAHYQLWVMRHRIPILEDEIATLRADIAENQQRIQNLQPSAIALAVLARLQANGVSDVALLDQMLERGEDWLDRMMQRLDYCEQVEDFIQGDYTQWCANSLEGAYDWIDTMRGSLKEEESVPHAEGETSEAEVQATAELLLHKLSLDDDEETMRDLRRKPPIPASEENVEPAEIPTFEQAMEMLGSTETAPSSQTKQEALEQAAARPDEQNALEQAATRHDEQPAPQEAVAAPEEVNEQPAPWYSISQNEANEPFDFTHPHSMDDWIKILQAETSANQEAAEERQAAAARLPEALATPPQETGETFASVQSSVESEAVVNAQTSIENEQGAHTEPATEPGDAETTLTEPEASKTEQDSTTVVNAPHEQPQVSPAATPEEEGAHLQSEAQETPEIEAARYEASEIEAEQHETPALQEHEVEASDLPETASVPSAEEEISRSAGEEMILPSNKPEESDEVTEQTVTEPAQTAHKESIASMMSETREESQHEMEEAALVNAIFEPEGEQRPWYEYLVIDKTVSGELYSAHELAEHSLFGGEQLNHPGGPLDETQPMARKAIQSAQEEQFTPEISLPTTDSESVTSREGTNLVAAKSGAETPGPEEGFPTLKDEPLTFENEVSAPLPQKATAEASTAHEDAGKLDVRPETSANLQAAAMDGRENAEGNALQQSTPAKQTSLEEAPIESTPPAAPQGASASASTPEPQSIAAFRPVQEPPKKLSFWQRLFRRKPKK